MKQMSVGQGQQMFSLVWSQWHQTGSANRKLLEVELLFIDQHTSGVHAVPHET